MIKKITYKWSQGVQLNVVYFSIWKSTSSKFLLLLLLGRACRVRTVAAVCCINITFFFFCFCCLLIEEVCCLRLQLAPSVRNWKSVWFDGDWGERAGGCVTHRGTASLLKSTFRESDLGVMLFVSRFFAAHTCRKRTEASLSRVAERCVQWAAVPVPLARHVRWGQLTGSLCSSHLRVWASVPITLSPLFTVSCDISPPGNWQPGCYCEKRLCQSREKE